MVGHLELKLSVRPRCDGNNLEARRGKKRRRRSSSSSRERGGGG
jgi:hypothetical protein